MTKVVPSNPPRDFGFGGDVDLRAGMLAIGADELDKLTFLFVQRKDQANWALASTFSAPFFVSCGSLARRRLSVIDGALLQGFPCWEAASPPGFKPGAMVVYSADGAPAILVPEDAASNDQFGNALSCHGEIGVVGAHRHDAAGDDVGAAYVLDLSVSPPLIGQKLLPSNTVPEGHFGSCVDVDGETIVIGAPAGVTCGAGEVFIFEPSQAGWVETQCLTPEDLGCVVEFGGQVAIDHDWLAVGAAGGAINIMMYERQGRRWTYTQTLNTPVPPVYPFGHVLDLEGSLLAAGHPHTDLLGEKSGSCHLYHHMEDGWHLLRTLLAPDGDEYDYFGIAVSLDGAKLAVGANQSVGGDPGAVYVFDIGSILGDIDCDSDADGADLGTMLASWGPCAACAADFNADLLVDDFDLSVLLAHWGALD